MSPHGAGTLPGIVLAVELALCLAVLGMHLHDATSRDPKNHLFIASASLLAFGMVTRLGLVIANLAYVTWSPVFAVGALLVFLATDHRLAWRWLHAWHHLTGQPRTGIHDRRRRA